MFEIKSDKIETVNKTFRIPVDLAKRLETLAQQQDISINSLIIQCCEYALKTLRQKIQKCNFFKYPLQKFLILYSKFLFKAKSQYPDFYYPDIGSLLYHIQYYNISFTFSLIHFGVALCA